jgi:hypothetical protein
MEKNKDLIESYKLTTLRDNIGIYGQRLLLRLVELATAEGATKDLNFKSGRDLRKIEITEDLFYKRVTMPLTHITGDSDNRSKPRKAIIALMQQIIEAEDEEGDWFAFPFLSYAQVKNGNLTVEVRKELWQVFMDFRKGFRRYELQAALHLKSTYSLRLYKLVSEQRDINYLDFQLDELKKMLGVGNKYPRAYDFGKYVLDPAKAELDRVAPWTFSYSWLTSRKQAGGRAAIVGVRFFPHYQPEHRDPDLAQKQIRLEYSEITAPELNQAQRNMLLHKFGFTQKGINNNQALFNTAVKYLDLTTFLLELAPRVSTLRPKNPTGYVINAIRMELAAQGIDA